MRRSHPHLAAALLTIFLFLSLLPSQAQQPPVTTAPPGGRQIHSGFYPTWLQEDVAWIITDEEKEAFKKLSNDEARDNFMDAFWRRRSPTPDTGENEFKEEHYHRIAYANERFGYGIPGWKSDRGRIYILLGWPDEIESHKAGEKLDQPHDATAVAPLPYPLGIWRYRYLEGIGQNMVLEFIDTCGCGDYHLTLGPSQNQALIPLSNLRGGPLRSVGGPKGSTGVVLPPPSPRAVPVPLQFPELAAAIQQVHAYPLPFDVRTDFVRLTSGTTLVPITLQFKNRDLTFKSQYGIDRAAVNIFGRVSSLTGRVLETFEDTIQVDVPSELLAKATADTSAYSHGSPLPPGRYKLNIAIKDANGERIGIWARAIVVPQFNEGLAASSLILSTMAQSFPEKPPTCLHIDGIGPGTGPPSCGRIIGRTQIAPLVPSADGKPVIFRRDQQINLWMQVYNLQVDDKKHAPSATIEYSLVNTETKAPVLHRLDSTDAMLPLADQFTLQKKISAAALPSGAYQFQIKVHDNYSGQTVSRSCALAVE